MKKMHVQPGAPIHIMEAAQELLKRMRTPGWYIRVWENLGWHYQIYNPKARASIYVSTVTGKFWCLFGGNEGEGGPTLLNDQSVEDRYFDDPNDAFASAVKYARSVVSHYDEIVKAGEAVLRYWVGEIPPRKFKSFSERSFGANRG